jgi:hypothetical protein
VRARLHAAMRICFVFADQDVNAAAWLSCPRRQLGGNAWKVSLAWSLCREMLPPARPSRSPHHCHQHLDLVCTKHLQQLALSYIFCWYSSSSC